MIQLNMIRGTNAIVGFIQLMWSVLDGFALSKLGLSFAGPLIVYLHVLLLLLMTAAPAFPDPTGSNHRQNSDLMW